MGDCTGSKKQYSFRLTAENTGEVHLFECAIDLLSYATLMKLEGKDWRQFNLVSLAGVYSPKQKIEDSKVPVTLGRLLADDCIQSIAIVGKAWGIPADETTRWQHAQQKQTRRVGGAEPRENTADSDMLHPAPGKAVKVMQLVWDMFETALDLGDDADRYRLFDTAHTLAAVYLPLEWLGSMPIVG